MKLSDGFRGLGQMWSGLVKGFDHLETAMAITGAMFGKQPLAGDGKGKKFAFAVHGLLGYEDEREFILLLEKLDSRGARVNRDAVLDWFHWQFPTGTVAEQAVAKWYGNKFRSFLLKFTDEKAKLRFLGRIAQEVTKGGGGVRGFRNARKELLRQSVPLPSDGIVEQVQTCIDQMSATGVATRQGYRDAKASLVRDTRRVERLVQIENARPKSWLDRLID